MRKDDGHDQIPLSRLHQHLRPVGVTQGPQSFPPGQVQAKRLQISKATNLRELADEYAFYTPGLLFSRIPLAPDLTASFIEERGIETIPFTLTVERPIFDGLECPHNHDPSWNYVLYAMEREHWHAFLAYIGTVAINYPAQRTIWRVRTQELLIFDPFGTITLATRPTRDDAVPVTAFVLESDKGCWLFNDLGTRPCAFFDKKMRFPDTAAFTRAIQQEKSNPYGEVNENCNPDAFGG